MDGLTPDSLFSENSSSEPSIFDKLSDSLSGLADSAIQRVGSSLINRATAAVSQPVQSQNNVPAPDLASKAATGSVSPTTSFAGVSIPILILGLGSIYLLFSKRRR